VDEDITKGISGARMLACAKWIDENFHEVIIDTEHCTVCSLRPKHCRGDFTDLIIDLKTKDVDVNYYIEKFCVADVEVK
jgi:hypothetical protein